jgi:hypothetical protein
VSKSFYQKKRQKIQNRFFLDLFYHVFGRFSVRGVQKHDKKISQKNLTSPGIFWASEEPTNHPKARRFFFVSAPCARRRTTSVAFATQELTWPQLLPVARAANSGQAPGPWGWGAGADWLLLACFLL